jgi:hypothetical protein
MMQYCGKHVFRPYEGQTNVMQILYRMKNTLVFRQGHGNIIKFCEIKDKVPEYQGSPADYNSITWNNLTATPTMNKDSLFALWRGNLPPIAAHILIRELARRKQFEMATSVANRVDELNETDEIDFEIEDSEHIIGGSMSSSSSIQELKSDTYDNIIKKKNNIVVIHDDELDLVDYSDEEEDGNNDNFPTDMDVDNYNSNKRTLIASGGSKRKIFDSNQSSIIKRSSSSSSSSLKWSCTTCTYDNDQNDSICEICGIKKI